MKRILLAVVRAAAAAVLASLVSACAAHGPSYSSHPARASLVDVEIYDRADGQALPLHYKDGRRYVVGAPGHEYALRIRNLQGTRVLVVTSVDGVNVISGETAAPSQSGYVLDPWSSVEIRGWRKSLARTAAFYFTDHRNSYAARTGRPLDVGVIGVAVFRERPRPIARRDYGSRGSETARNEEAAPSAASPAESAADTADAQERHEATAQARSRPPQAAAKLGTGHGRNEASHVTLVDFRRASASPAETIAIHYDRRENLVAMGVIAADAPYITQREPQPFPGSMRFAPDPHR